MTKTLLMRTVLCAAAFFPASLPAADYLPLQTGNTWVYEIKGAADGGTITARVSDSAEYNGKTYYRYEFGGSAQWLRSDSSRIYRWDDAAQQESPYLDFTVPIGSAAGQSTESCTGQALLKSRGEAYQSRLGELLDTAAISYGVTCADAGLTFERYAAGLGLVTRESTTFAGPRTYELVSAKINGVETAVNYSLTFSGSLTKRTYTHGAEPAVLRARLSLVNGDENFFTLVFPTSQEADIIVRDAAGDVVTTWSAGRLFAQATHRVVIQSGPKEWLLALPLADKEGKPLLNSHYSAELVLVNSGARYSTTIPFSIFPIQGNER